MKAEKRQKEDIEGIIANAAFDQYKNGHKIGEEVLLVVNSRRITFTLKDHLENDTLFEYIMSHKGRNVDQIAEDGFKKSVMDAGVGNSAADNLWNTNPNARAMAKYLLRDGFMAATAERKIRASDNISLKGMGLGEIPKNYLNALKDRGGKAIEDLVLEGNDLEDLSFLDEVDAKVVILPEVIRGFNVSKPTFYRSVLWNEDKIIRAVPELRKEIEDCNNNHVQPILVDKYHTAYIDFDKHGERIIKDIDSSESCRKVYEALNPTRDQILESIAEGGISDRTVISAITKLGCKDIQSINHLENKVRGKEDKDKLLQIAKSLDKRCNVETKEDLTLLL